MNNLEQLQYEAFMLNASSETVYHKLKQHYDACTDINPLSSPSYCSEELAKQLVNRKEALINVGMASFCPLDEMLLDIFEKQQSLRSLVLSNKFCFSWSIGTNALIDKFRKVIFADLELAKTALSNPSFPASEMADFIERAKPYDKIRMEDWQSLLAVALKSPLVKPKDMSDYGPDDGWGWHTDNKPSRALTKSLLILPQTSTYLIYAVLHAMEEVDNLTLSDDEKKEYQLEYEYSALPTLQKILTHWEGGETQPEYYDQDMRTILVGKLSSSDKDSIKWVEQSEDDKLIVGLLSFKEDLKPSELKGLYKKYDRDFICAGLHNKSFYRQKGKPTPLAVEFEKIVSDCEYDDNEPYGHLYSAYESVGAKLNADKPHIYFNPAKIDWYDTMEVLDDNEVVNDEFTLQQRLEDLLTSAQGISKNHPEIGKFAEKLSRTLVPVVEQVSNKGFNEQKAQIQRIRSYLWWLLVLVIIVLFRQ